MRSGVDADGFADDRPVGRDIGIGQDIQNEGNGNTADHIPLITD